MNKPVFTLMVGFPRSGKSTWVENHKHEGVVVSPDEIRCVVFGHQFHEMAEGFIWGMTKAMVVLILSQGKSVILDCTSMNGKKRLEWRMLAEDCGARHFRIVWVDTPVEVCLERNLASGSKTVPDQVVHTMARFFQPPSKLECDELVVIKNWK